MEYLLLYETFIGIPNILGSPEIILKISQTKIGYTSADLCVPTFLQHSLFPLFDHIHC